MWYEGAIKLPGPEAKTSGKLDATGVTLHSAEYDLPEDDKILHNALMELGREASWHFTITRPPFAFIFQHYEVNLQTWHCGLGNPYTIGIELEGVAPARCEGAQYELLVRLLKWVRKEQKWVSKWNVPLGSAPPIASTSLDSHLFEHAQWMSTDCAIFSNNQLDAAKLIADLKEEEMEAPLFQPENRPEVYYLVGGKLFHIPDQAVFIAAGYKPEAVTVLPADNPIWNLTVEYLRVPAPLR